MTTPVSDLGANAAENITHAAEVIGRSVHRRLVFDAIYTGKQKAKSVAELMKTTRLSNVNVLHAGRKFLDNHIVNRGAKINGLTSYEKIGFFQQHKKRILALAKSPRKLAAYPTKRNPRTAPPIITFNMSSDRARIKPVSIDDIQSFRKAWNVDSTDPLGDRLSETAFKRGLLRVLGQSGTFKDWGGETQDVFTTRMRIGATKSVAALALKGPATKGKLTPGKMGKNGDQIQRLFEAPAEIFFVQYCRDIEPSVLKQMQQLAVNKSLMTSGRKIRYGIINGQDSRRLVMAYPRQFAASKEKR